MTGTGQDSSAGTAKKSKPAMEKRRRARINASLLELRDLIPESRQRLNKMEKADILEMTVKHLKRLQETNKNLEKNNPSSRSYSLGFDECTQEVSEFFGSTNPLTSEIKLNLLNHLRRCAPHNPPDSPSSSPSKAATVSATTSTPLPNSTTAPCTNTNTNTNSNTSTNSNTTNNNNNSNAPKILPASIADSILSRCLLSTYPTTASSSSSKTTPCLSTSSTGSSTNSSQSKPNILIASDRNNVSTPIAVSSTSDESPPDPVFHVVQEPAMEIDDWRSRLAISEERSPSPSQVASTRILALIRSTKVKGKSSHTSTSSGAGAMLVKRDLLNAFQEDDGNNNSINAPESFNDSNNNFSTSHSNDSLDVMDKYEQRECLPISCKSNRTRTNVSMVNNHSNFVVNQNDFRSKFPHHKPDTFFPNQCVVPKSDNQNSQECPISNSFSSFNTDTNGTNGDGDMIMESTNTSSIGRLANPNQALEISSNTNCGNEQRSISDYPKQKLAENGQAYLIPIYIQTEGNELTPKTSTANGTPTILSEAFRIQNTQPKESVVFTHQSKPSSFQMCSTGEINQLCEINQFPKSDTNRDTHVINPLATSERQMFKSGTQHDYFEIAKSPINRSYLNVTSIPSMSETPYKNRHEIDNDSGFLEYDDDDDIPPIRSTSNSFSARRIKKVPLALRIENSTSCCNSDDECHESGHITSDSARNSNEIREWVWGYAYDSDEDDDEMLAGPTLAKRIRSLTDTSDSSSVDNTSAPNSRKNSFSKRFGEFRLRKGSLSQKLNKYKLNKARNMSTADPLRNCCGLSGSNEFLRPSSDELDVDLTSDRFRRRCFTYSQRPSRPIVPLNSTLQVEPECVGDSPPTTLTHNTNVSGTLEEISENGQTTPRSRGNSNAREFLTARRRCATVSAKDLLRKRPILPKKFIEPAGSEESVSEDDGHSNAAPDNKINFSSHIRGFERSSDLHGPVTFRNRCSTFSSSRTSSAARELDLTHPCQASINKNDRIALRQNDLYPNTLDTVDTSRKVTTHESLDLPRKTFEELAKSDPETKQEHSILPQSNSNTTHIGRFSAPKHQLFIEPTAFPYSCPKSPLNHSSKSDEYVIPTRHMSDLDISNETKHMTYKLTSEQIEYKKYFQSSVPFSPKLIKFCEDKPEHSNRVSPQETSPLNLSTKSRRYSVQYGLDTDTTRTFHSQYNCVINNTDKDTDNQCPSTINLWIEHEDLRRPRSWSVSTGMSSLSLGGPNRPHPVASTDDEDENVWRPW